MTAGNQPSLAGINQTAGNLAITLRDVMQDIQNFNAYLGSVGGAAFLQNTLGMQGGDAAALIAAYGNLVELCAAYNGTGTIPALFNFEANSNILWGGL